LAEAKILPPANRQPPWLMGRQPIKNRRNSSSINKSRKIDGHTFQRYVYVASGGDIDPDHSQLDKVDLRGDRGDLPCLPASLLRCS